MMSAIAVSAGHHPHKTGASNGDFIEHHEAVIWQNKICELLGPDVAIKVPVGVLRNKVTFINENRPVLAVEIHFNDAVVYEGEKMRHIGRGSETLYYPNSKKGKAVATIMQKELAKEFGPDRGAKEGWYRMRPEFGADYFLKKTKCVSIIIEPEFVANEQKIRTNRQVGCEAIATAIKEAIAYLEL